MEFEAALAQEALGAFGRTGLTPSQLGEFWQKNQFLPELLRRIDHTLWVHGKVDADTPLHKMIKDAIGGT